MTEDELHDDVFSKGYDLGKREAGQQQANEMVRPQTPVGWSDTDWIKHLQDHEGHPLMCLHINKGSLDAAAEAYESEYNAWKKSSDFAHE